MRTKTEEQNILHVQMFGKFSMVWKNNMLIGNAKSGETQFAYLMQMLLHNRKEGVSRLQDGTDTFLEQGCYRCPSRYAHRYL